MSTKKEKCKALPASINPFSITQKASQNLKMKNLAPSVYHIPFAEFHQFKYQEKSQSNSNYLCSCGLKFSLLHHVSTLAHAIFDERKQRKIEKTHDDLKTKYEKAKIEIDSNIDLKLHQEAIQYIGSKRSRHSMQMAKCVKRAKAYEIVYDRFLEANIKKETMKAD